MLRFVRLHPARFVVVAPKDHTCHASVVWEEPYTTNWGTSLLRNDDPFWGCLDQIGPFSARHAAYDVPNRQMQVPKMDKSHGYSMRQSEENRRADRWRSGITGGKFRAVTLRSRSNPCLLGFSSKVRCGQSLGWFDMRIRSQTDVTSSRSVPAEYNEMMRE